MATGGRKEKQADLQTVKYTLENCSTLTVLDRREKERERQTDRQTDIQTDRQTDRGTERKKISR